MCAPSWPLSSRPWLPNKMSKKIKITSTEQPCPRCSGKLKRATHRTGWKPKQNACYYFEWWFQCLDCKSFYMIEAAKRFVKGRPLMPLPVTCFSCGGLRSEERRVGEEG